MNLREFCRLPGLPVAITTTFNVDPLFVERVVLYDLIAGGARRILLADEHQALTSITAVQGQLVSLGRQYRLIPVKVKGSFHPKICVRFNTTRSAGCLWLTQPDPIRMAWLWFSRGGAGESRVNNMLESEIRHTSRDRAGTRAQQAARPDRGFLR